MRIKKLFFLIIVGILIIYFLQNKRKNELIIFSCTRVIHDTTVIRDTIIKNNIALGFLNEWEQIVYLFASPLPNLNTSDAKLMWENNVRQFSYKDLQPGYLVFYDMIELTPEKMYSLKITSNVGTCSGAVRIPGNTYFTHPRYGETLQTRSSVTVRWATANYADFYWLEIFIMGYDSLGNPISQTGIDTFITPNSYIISSSFFSEPTVAYFEIAIDVYPLAGVYPAPNNEGNIKGDIVGYLIGEGEGEWTYFYVGTPLYGKFRSKNKKELRKKLENNYINLVKASKFN